MKSILLNCNPNLYGNKPYKFVNHFSENIEIKSGEKIALYSANITKPVINLERDEQFNFNILIDNNYNTYSPYTINSFNGDFNDDNIIINIIVKKGTYTVYELLKHIETQANTAIQQYLLDNTTQYTLEYIINWQYKFSARFIEGKPYLFLDSYYPTSNFSGITDNTKRYNTLFGTGANQGDLYPNTLVDVNNWNTWGCFSDIMNVFNGLTNFNTKDNIRKSTIYFELDHVNGEVGDYFFCFNNLKYVPNWVNVSTPTLLPSTDDYNLPSCYIGVRFSFFKLDPSSNKINCEIALYENSGLSSIGIDDTNIINGRLNCVYKVSLDNLSNDDPNFFNNNVFGFTFYQKNDLELTNLFNTNTYYKFHTTYTNNNLINTYDNGILYDSAQNGRIIDTTLVINTLIYGDPFNEPAIIPRTDMSPKGLQAFGFFSTLSTGTGNNNQYGFKKVRGNRLKINGNTQNSDVLSIYSYNINILTDTLKELFSFSQKKRICPIYFDINKPDYETVIINEIYEDNKNYNIIIKNLPLRTYNFINDKSNIGSKSSIIYNISGLFNNKIINPSTNFSTNSIYPKQLKYLSLNNPSSINLNKLEIEIRNANTNQLSEELIYSTIELLIG